MKIKLLLITLLLGAGTLQAQQPKAIAARATRATLFFRGAELTHTASAALVRGENVLRIEGLSPGIDRSSLKVTTTGGAVVSASEFSVDYLVDRQTDTVLKRLEDSLEVAADALAKVEIDRKINAEMIALLRKGTDKNVAGSEAGLGIADLIKTMDYYQSKSEQMHTRQIALDKRQAELGALVARLQAQIDQQTSGNSRISGVLRLVLVAPSATTTSLTISYFTPDASWSPYYDITVASSERPVTIAARSKVRQTTGFDWEKVHLTLSTATPSNGKVAPLFDAWFLRQLYPQQPRLYGAKAMAAAPMAQNSYAYAELAEQEAVMPAEASVMTMDDHIVSSENALSVTYAIDLPYTIPGNGREQNIDLQTRQVPAEYKYYCAPRLDEQVYLLAEIADWQQLELLSGPANITYEGTYIGQSRIDASSTRDKLSLTLGTDKRVTVKREVLRDFTARKELGGNVSQTFAYRITVRNNRTAPIALVLKDQYPISTQKEIEVALDTKTTTPFAANKTDTGVITWEESLTAGELKTYRIDYSVRYPKGMNLNL